MILCCYSTWTRQESALDNPGGVATDNYWKGVPTRHLFLDHFGVGACGVQQGLSGIFRNQRGKAYEHSICEHPRGYPRIVLDKSWGQPRILQCFSSGVLWAAHCHVFGKSEERPMKRGCENPRGYPRIVLCKSSRGSQGFCKDSLRECCGAQQDRSGISAMKSL